MVRRSGFRLHLLLLAGFAAAVPSSPASAHVVGCVLTHTLAHVVDEIHAAAHGHPAHVEHSHPDPKRCAVQAREYEPGLAPHTVRSTAPAAAALDPCLAVSRPAIVAEDSRRLNPPKPPGWAFAPRIPRAPPAV